MTVAETINRKIVHLPPKAQKEILEIIEEIETRYTSDGKEELGNSNGKHLFDALMEIAIDGPPDLAERHHLYAHGKVEDRD